MTLNCNKINLKKGSIGAEVKEIQSLLVQYGYYSGKIDGNYGDLTVSSVKSFQKALSLTVDGIVGPITCKKVGSLSTINKDIKSGSTGEYVIIVQNKLKTLGYYTATVDGQYGSKTVTSVKNYQKNKALKQDGIVGSITYNSLLQTTKNSNNQISTKTSTVSNGVYTNNTLCEKSGGDCLGQITSYHCGPHSIKQVLRKFGITKYTESTIGGYAGTTSAGTGHWGLETAIAKIAKLEGITLKVEWKNFSEFGNTQKERFKKYAELMTDEKKALFWHELYRDQFGHYSFAKTINTNKNNIIIPNSLGNKCKSPAFCGYMETRDYSTQNRYINGISQKSICIITKV